jgi:hypothetical protein
MAKIIEFPKRDPFLPNECEGCGRRNVSLAWFRGNVICWRCYFSVPKGFRDAIDAAILEYEAKRSEVDE